MKEFVTLFSFLPFTNVCALILPITSENFLIFFIAFIVTFFLLGFIIGYILNPRRKLRMIKEKQLNRALKDNQEAAYSPRQDFPAYDTEQQRRTDNRNQRDRDRDRDSDRDRDRDRDRDNYNGYKDYSDSARRY